MTHTSLGPLQSSSQRPSEHQGRGTTSDAWRSFSLGGRWTPGSPCPNIICPPEIPHRPMVPGSYGLPPIWRESRTGVSRLLTSAPDQDKDITVSIPIPARLRSPGPFITAGGWDGCNYRSHRLSSARGFSRSAHRRCQEASKSHGVGGGLAALCHTLPRHSPGPPPLVLQHPVEGGEVPGGGVGKDIEALPSGPRQSWILTSPGAGRARLGHSRRRLARAPGAVRTEAASHPAERLPFPAACGWLSPHPRDHPTLVSGAQSSALREATCRQ